MPPSSEPLRSGATAARATAIAVLASALAFAASCSGERTSAADAAVQGDAGRSGAPVALDAAIADAARARDGASAPDGDAAAGCQVLPDAGTPEPIRVDPEDGEVDTESHAFFRIRVVDRESGAPLAGAVLTTTNFIALRSDLNGLVAFYEPGLMATDVFFSASYPGYELPADSFGVRGRTLTVREGGEGEIALDRIASDAGPVVTTDLDTRLLEGPVPAPAQCFGVRAIDRDTRRGVPLVRLAEGGDEYWSDSHGWIALCRPDRLEQRLRFELSSHGYRLPSGDGSVELDTTAGARAELELERMYAAERLYRITGQGIYRDSALLGRSAPTAQPLLNGLVAGQDTVQATVYGGRVFWAWGDTARFAHALGNFRGTSAISELPPRGLSPHLGVDLRYFVGADGFAKQMAPPDTVPGEGLAWLSSLVALPDATGQERLFASYGLFRSLQEQTEAGVLRYDDDREQFVKALALPSVDALGPNGHPTRVRHEGGEYVYYQPTLRIPARAEAVVDPQSYESFTAYREGTTELERAADGSLSYGWKRATAPLMRAALQAQGVAADQSLDGHVRDPDSGEAVDVHAGSSRAWNRHRGRFVQMTAQQFGTSSFLGEIWYAEADTPMGPWVYARKIVSHDRFTFYNPRQHPFFDQAGGRVIFFEGTYTTSFVAELTPTPRYEYNQIMYRLDVDDPRLVLPVPVYDLGDEVPGDFVTKAELPDGAAPQRAAFLAPDRAAPGLVPVSWSGAACGPPRRLVVGGADLRALFYALPADAAERPEQTVPLHEYAAQDGRHAYSVDGALALAEFTRADAPIAYVWPSPIAVALPVADFQGDVRAAAGADLCLTAPQAGAAVKVALDAGESSSRAGDIIDYVWHLPPDARCAIAVGEHAEVELPGGVHVIRLEVEDSAGNRDSDELIVQVAAP